MKRVANIVFLSCFLAALIAVPVCTLFSEKVGTSYYENRTLASLPTVSVKTISDGTFFSDLETYFSDHIAWRDPIMKLKTWSDLNVFHRPVVGDTVVNSDVLLYFHGYQRKSLDGLDAQAAEMGDKLQKINDQVTDYGGYFCYFGLTNHFTYFSDHYPSYIDNRLWQTESTVEAFSNALTEREVPFLNMTPIYDAQGRPPEYYSATDHHYTYRGMLSAYDALMKRINSDTALDLQILTPDDLTLTTLPNPFLGSRERKLYNLWPSDEHITIGTLKEEIPFTRTDNGAEVPATFYALPATQEEPLPYGVYMGGDIGETIIRTNRGELPKALIFGDSFTNAMETVFWASFDETRYLDLRHYTDKALSDYLADYQPDVVICLRDDNSYLSA
ncbi:MAG: hypothetical protein RR949_03520, partial [Oscillospiraceae bacterium]